MAFFRSLFLIFFLVFSPSIGNTNSDIIEKDMKNTLLTEIVLDINAHNQEAAREIIHALFDKTALYGFQAYSWKGIIHYKFGFSKNNIQDPIFFKGTFENFNLNVSDIVIECTNLNDYIKLLEKIDY
ncbi:MAG: hypothetical protein LBU06_06095 [Desulfovibrio sp.]|jgi:hypothetical protein|nr:hypothetical protein [Desulfovibrio sp.]